MSYFPCNDSIVQRSTQKKMTWETVFTFCQTVLRTNISVNQLSLYGAVAEMCEEYETLHDRTVRPVGPRQKWPLDCDDHVRKDLLLQQHGKRIEKLSQQDKLSKFCMDAGFLNVFEIGQYFMTKDTAEFSQFTDAVA